MKTIKVFISQQMNGLSEDTIRQHRAEIKKDVQVFLRSIKLDSDDIEVVNVIDQEPGHERVWYLGQSISKMEDADFIVFSKDWIRAYGCEVEMEVCKRYFNHCLSGEGFGSNTTIDRIFWK